MSVLAMPTGGGFNVILKGGEVYLMFSRGKKSRGANTSEYSLLVCMLLLTGLSMTGIEAPFLGAVNAFHESSETPEFNTFSLSGSASYSNGGGSYYEFGNKGLQLNASGGGSDSSGAISQPTVGCDTCLSEESKENSPRLGNTDSGEGEPEHGEIQFGGFSANPANPG